MNQPPLDTEFSIRSLMDNGKLPNTFSFPNLIHSSNHSDLINRANTNNYSTGFCNSNSNYLPAANFSNSLLYKNRNQGTLDYQRELSFDLDYMIKPEDHFNRPMGHGMISPKELDGVSHMNFLSHPTILPPPNLLPLQSSLLPLPNSRPNTGSNTPLSVPSITLPNDLNSEGNMLSNLKPIIFDNLGNNFINSRSVSLVQQLYMDKPLLKAISKKQKRGYYKCTHCPETYASIFDYARHMDQFNIKREYKCPFELCPWKILGLPRRSDLRRHCAIQHKEELPNTLKEELNLHDEMYPVLKCQYDFCDKAFIRRDSYNRHVSIVHEKDGSRFNKRLSQILSDCPNFKADQDKNEYVQLKMKNFKKKNRVSK